MNCPNENWNWPKKTKISLKHIITYTTNWLASSHIWVVAFIALTVACEVPKEIGLPPNSLVGVVLTDTVTVRTSTLLLDSVRTSRANQMLVGSYRDPLFGQINSNAFFEFGNGEKLPTDKTYEYDSVALVLGLNYVYGDTLGDFKINVHRLTDTLQTNKTYYNNSKVAYQPTALASATFKPHLSQRSSVKVVLPNDFGREIFSFIRTNTTTSTSEFIKAIKGFAFVADASNTAIVGSAANTIAVLLYYHESGTTSPLSAAYVTVVRRFNQIQAQRQGTELAKLQPLQPLKPSQTGGLNYVQDALGVVTKVEFPYIDNLLKQKIAINRAELTITPELRNINAGGSYLPIPGSLIMIETDGTNRILRSKSGTELILTPDGETFTGSITPQVVPYDSRYKYYNFVLSTYLQALSVGYKKNNGLILTPNEIQAVAADYSPSLNTKVSRLTIDPAKVKLKLFYTKSN